MALLFYAHPAELDASRDDAVAILPEHRTCSAAGKVRVSLVARKLMREVRNKADMPVWREDGERRFSLVLLKNFDGPQNKG